MGKHLSNKYSQKRYDSAKKSTKDVIKASERAIQKTAEATGDLIGNKVCVLTELHSKFPTRSKNDGANSEIEAPKKRYISPEERQQNIDKLRLV